MKKLILLSIVFITSLITNAQFGNAYNSVDSTYTNTGGWSFLPMYAQKDSTVNSDSYFFKSYHRNFHFMNNSIKRNKSFSQSSNFILVDSITGKVYSSKFIPFSRILGAPAGTIYTPGTGIGIASNVITNTAPDQTVSLTAGTNIIITGTYPNFTISAYVPTPNVVLSKTLNSNFTLSTTKQAFVSYSLTCTVTNPLLAGSSTANAFLEYSTNGGSTWLLPSQNGNASTVGVAVAIAITNGQTVTLSGYIPANALVRIRTATTGTATVTYITGQETY